MQSKRKAEGWSISFQILERGVSGDLGYDVGIYTLTQTGANGAAQTGRPCWQRILEMISAKAKT